MLRTNTPSDKMCAELADYVRAPAFPEDLGRVPEFQIFSRIL